MRLARLSIDLMWIMAPELAVRVSKSRPRRRCIMIHPKLRSTMQRLFMTWNTVGQRGDSPKFEVVLGRIRAPRLGPRRPAAATGLRAPAGHPVAARRRRLLPRSRPVLAG